MNERAIPTPNRRYESYRHETMRDEVESGNDPSAAGEIGLHWGELAGRLRESTQELRNLSTGSVELWQGTAGDALRGVLDKAAGWSDEAAEISAAVAEAVSQQASVAARARAEMPEPVAYDPAAMIREAAAGGDIQALVGLSDALAQRREDAEAARQKAVDVMNNRDAELRAAVPRTAFAAPPTLTGDRPAGD
ncbi:hypothetical protein FB471_6139 [Amycolatopsis cihanbeyliensis]|uniref:PPE family protein n=2 Tax=Amycolatopsis cihanbeyliensis TaxID=1128664 RepID=A0A542CT45_AMYCI|nr:hypothetical protein FB471_6139 [Amycolatopsis cihanbeyliensis]